MSTIGVFDSGVGGLTVLRALHARLPGFSTAYLGDTARVPYGTRSRETVIRYALNAGRALAAREDLAVLVVACNTASAVAIEPLREVLTVPVIGVVEPTARRAVELTRSGRIGILGTRGTIDSGAYERAVRACSRPGLDVKTFPRACPLFVPLAEEGWTEPDDPVARAVAERYLEPVLAEGVDTLILGCTHYPLLEDTIRSVAGEGVALAEASLAIAEEIATLLGDQPGSGEGVALAEREPFRRYYLTDLPRGFAAVAERFLGSAIPAPIEIDL